MAALQACDHEGHAHMSLPWSPFWPMAWPRAWLWSWPRAYPPLVDTAVSVDPSQPVATMPAAYVGFNFDWHYYWPERNALTIDLSDAILVRAVQALAPATLRVGGTPGDAMIYDVDATGCSAESVVASHSCLPLTRFSALVRFCEQNRLDLIFQLNALTFRGDADGKCARVLERKDERNPWLSPMPPACADAPLDTRNIDALFAFAAARGLRVHAFELGNELHEVAPETFGRDLRAVGRLLRRHWPRRQSRPLLLGASLNPRTGEALGDRQFYPRLVSAAAGTLDVITYHVYTAEGGGKAPGPEEVATGAFLDTGLRLAADVVEAWRELRRTPRRLRPEGHALQPSAARAHGDGCGGDCAAPSDEASPSRGARRLGLIVTESAALWHSGQHGITVRRRAATAIARPATSKGRRPSNRPRWPHYHVSRATLRAHRAADAAVAPAAAASPRRARMPSQASSGTPTRLARAPRRGTPPSAARRWPGWHKSRGRWVTPPWSRRALMARARSHLLPLCKCMPP